MIRLARVVALACSLVVLPFTAAQAVTVDADRLIRRSADAVRGSYIVVLRGVSAREVPGVANGLARAHGATVRFTYASALRGFAIQGTEASARGIARDPRVAFVEEDGRVSADATQSSPPWGLDRIDQRGLPLGTAYTYNETGAGVRAYIIDTGVRTTHTDFGGRASSGYDAIDGGAADDCNGHGTHVAGTVGGTTYGVAKAVSLVAVRVLDCKGEGTWSQVIAGVDWVKNNAIKPAVANMSLGGGASSAVDTAVRNAIASGVSFALAAGNGDFWGRAIDACNTSPARVAEAITVSATDSSDARASFANYGSCVDLFAPGVSVRSDYSTSDTATATMSGTSMAAPHVAGVAAQYLQSNPGASPAAVAGALNGNATTGVVSNPGSGSPNRLLYNVFGTVTPNSPPVANFSVDACPDGRCTFTDASTDSDGIVAGWTWNFGDGTSSATRHPVHAYATSGTYTVTLTAADDGGATATTSRSVTVTVPSTGIFLAADGYKTKGVQTVDLVWSGASGGTVDIFRNTTKITTANDGVHTDNIGKKGSATYTYKVCLAGTTTCSNTETVVF